jgi:hypothetical protein
MCKPIRYSVLGIKILVQFNNALIGKWLWRYATETNTLWRHVVAMKYGNELVGWASGVFKDPYGVSLWKHIHNRWGRFSQFIKFVVGNRFCVRFLLDLLGWKPKVLEEEKKTWVLEEYEGKETSLTT